MKHETKLLIYGVEIEDENITPKQRSGDGNPNE